MNTLLVFLKYPEPGKVKTRLAATIGRERAAELYRGWIEAVFASIQPVRDRVRIIAYFDGSSLEAFSQWHKLADEWQPQPAGDLGLRLSHGFALACAAQGPVAAIGTDCPDLDAPLVVSAFEALRDHDAVFGPAADGGYYLVGTARALPDFFGAIPWSTQKTLDTHLSLCRENGWRYTLLPTLEDIDTYDSLKKYLIRRHNTL